MMTIRVLSLALGLCVCYTILQAQTYDQAASQLQFVNHYGNAYKKGYTGPEYSGSEFLHPEWMPMALRFRDTTLRFDAVKVNLLSGNLDIMFEGVQRSVSNVHFEYVATTDSHSPRKFYPAFKTYFNDRPLNGFIEYLGEGDEKVVVQHSIFVKEPLDQAHIVGGSTIPRLLKQTDSYILNGVKLTQIKRKKDLQDYYRKKSQALEKYLKENKTDITNPFQLAALVDHMSRKS